MRLEHALPRGDRRSKVSKVLHREPAPLHRPTCLRPSAVSRSRSAEGCAWLWLCGFFGSRWALRWAAWRGRRIQGEGAGGEVAGSCEHWRSSAAPAGVSVRHRWGAGVARRSAQNEGPAAAQNPTLAHTPLRGYATLPSLYSAALTLLLLVHVCRLIIMAANAKEGIGRQRKRLSVVSGNSLIDGLAAAAIEDSAVS